MTFIVGLEEVERFREVVARRLGLQFDDTRVGQLGEVLDRRIEATGRSCDDYLRTLESDAARAELGTLARELTVTETYFFRNIEQFRVLADHVLPERMAARRAVRHLRLLSAGCASGDEAYTIAIVARGLLDPSWGVTIDAVDMNPAVLERARRARCSAWSLRETPLEVRERWFRQTGREFVLDDEIRDAVTFEQRNLAEPDPDLWRPETYDVVFCRNVIMYLTPAAGRELVARIERSLLPGGFLFLGHAETLRGISDEFELRHLDDAFLYQRRDGAARPAAPPPVATGSRLPSPTSAPLASLVEATDSWVAAIRAATERVHRLTTTAAPDGPGRSTGPPWDLGMPLRLLQEERFAEALDVVDALPPAAAADRDVLLLRAVLLAHHGDLAAAEHVCRRLLELDGFSAGAHYVLALCREGAHDIPGSIDHDRTAIYLDAGFAMPHLHLGLLARRQGTGEVLRAELEQATALLEHEDASRLLLFGGGFSREALIELCRAEILASGALA